MICPAGPSPRKVTAWPSSTASRYVPGRMRRTPPGLSFGSASATVLHCPSPAAETTSSAASSGAGRGRRAGRGRGGGRRDARDGGRGNGRGDARRNGRGVGRAADQDARRVVRVEADAERHGRGGARRRVGPFRRGGGGEGDGDQAVEF